MTRMFARLCAALLGFGLVLLAVPAWAHVSVSSTDASQGGFGKAVFRVPNESDTASTTKVQITFPTDTPFAFVSAGAKPGWTVDTDTEKLDSPKKVGEFELTEIVKSITWTTTGDGIPSGQFDEFAISGGSFPEAEDIAFSATQTYSDGEVVNWDEEQKGETEPEHPAPALALSAAEAGADHHGGEASDDTEEVASASANVSNDGIALTVAIAAAVVAAAALLVSVRQNRRRA